MVIVTSGVEVAGATRLVGGGLSTLPLMPSAAALDERPPDLDARFARGDADALREAYDAHGALVFSLCLRGLPSREEAEDAAQQAFVAAWRARASFDPARGSLGGWLAGITRNKVVDAQRALYRRQDLVVAAESAASGERQDAGVAPGADAVADQLVVRAALQRLAPERRAVLELSFFGGLTHAEIAEQVGLPLGTVKSHIRRGLEALRVDLEASDG